MNLRRNMLIPAAALVLLVSSVIIWMFRIN